MEVKVTGKKWYESKTLWFNVVTTALQFLNLLMGVATDPETLAALVMVQGLGNIILRVFFTDSPIGEKSHVAGITYKV